MTEPTAPRIGRVSRFLIQGFAELFFYLPVPLIASVYALDTPAAWVWLLTVPIGYAACAEAELKFKPVRPITRMIAAAAAGIVYLFIAFMFTGHATALLLPLALVGAAAAVQGQRAARLGSWAAAFPGPAILAGIILHLAGQLAAFNLAALADYGPFMAGCGIAAVAAALFIRNERQLSGEDEGRPGPAMAAFKRHNRGLTAILVAFIVIVGLFRIWQQWLETAAARIANAVISWLSRPGKELPTEEPPPAPPAPQLPEAEAPREPAAWLVWLEQAFKWIVGILVVAALAAAAFWLGRALYRIARKWLGRLLQRSRDTREFSEVYEDEVESLMTLTKWSEQWKGRLAEIMPGRNGGKAWNQMPGSQRVRYLYGSMLKRSIRKGYAFKPHLTPQETASDIQSWRQAGKDGEKELIRIYDDVRYGGAEPPLEETERLKRLLEEPN